MQIYCTNHWSGAFLVLSVRTVVRGERVSRSIVNRTTALWSIWMVSSLVVIGLGSESIFAKLGGAESLFRAALTVHPKIAQRIRPKWTLPLTSRERT